MVLVPVREGHIRPCPFCGGEALLDREGSRVGFMVFCDTCMIHTVRATYGTVLYMWNSRVTKKPRGMIIGEGRDWDGEKDGKSE